MVRFATRVSPVRSAGTTQPYRTARVDDDTGSSTALAIEMTEA